MSNNPVIRFGLTAYVVANQARLRQLSRQGQMDLAMRALELPEIHHKARWAVRHFLLHAEARPEATGERLRNFLNFWLDEFTPSATAEEIAGGKDNATLFDWETRKDTGHD